MNKYIFLMTKFLLRTAVAHDIDYIVNYTVAKQRNNFRTEKWVVIQCVTNAYLNPRARVHSSGEEHDLRLSKENKNGTGDW
jgi:hypothetical protein